MSSRLPRQIRRPLAYKICDVIGACSLILLCRINMSVQDKEAIVELLEDKVEDDIQHVHLMTVQRSINDY